VGQESPGQANRHNPNGRYSNDFREGLVEISIGFVAVLSEIPPVQIKGGGLIIDGTCKVIRGAINYVWPEPDDRDYRRDRDRDGQRPSMADRDMDRQGGGGRDSSRN